MSVVTKQIRELDPASEVEGDDYLVIQTSGGVTKNTTKDILLQDYISTSGGIISGGLQIDGGLTVNGTLTTINTVDLVVEDNFVTLNSGVSGAPTLDSGIIVDRGATTDAKLTWNETNDRWELGTVGNTSRIITENDINTINYEMTTSNSIDILDSYDVNISAGCKWLVVLNDGTNYRMSEILAVWDSISEQITFSETSSTDLGDTSSILFAVDISGGNVRLMVAIGSGTWDFRIQRILV